MGPFHVAVSPSRTFVAFSAGVLFVLTCTIYRVHSNTSQMARKIPISIRLDPEVKADADKLAKLQHRSLSNLIEILLIEACDKHGINAD